MAVEVERLMARVEADISKYEKTMAKVGVLFEKQADAVERRNSAMVTKVNKSWDALGKANKFVGLSSAAGAIAGLTAVGVVTGLGALVRKSLDAASAIGDTAVQAGVSVEKLQELRFAASQSGASFNDLDRGMMKLNQTMGEFINTGAGPAAVAFKKIGLDKAINAGQIHDAGDAFEYIASKINKFGTEAQKGSILAKIFGEDAGPKLLQLMEQGRTGIEKLTAQANSLGIVLDTKTVEGAKEANDKLDALFATIKAQGVSALAQFAPQVAGLADSVVKSLPDLVKWVEKWGQFFGLIQLSKVEQLSLALDSAKEQLAALEKRNADAKTPAGFFGKVGSALGIAPSKTGGLEFLIDQQKVHVADLTRQLAEAQKAAKTATPAKPAGGANVAVPPTDAELKAMQALAEKRQDFLNKTLLDAKTAEAAWIASQDRAAVERLKGLDGYHDALVKQIEDERKAKLAAIDDEYAKEMDALAKLNYAKSSPAYRRAASAIEGSASAKRGAVNTEADASLYAISDTSAITEAVRQGAALVAMYDSEAAALRMTAGEAAKAAYIQQQLNDAKARGIPITKEFTAAVEAEGDEVGAAAQRSQDAQDGNDLREMVRQSFRDGIRTAIEGGDIRDVFANLAQNFADKMADRLGDQLFDLFDKLLSDMFSDSKGGGGGGILDFLGSAIGSLFGGGGGSGGGSAGLDSVPFQLFPRASGGPVAAGQNYLIGEQGPEIFSPGRSGMITPNSVFKMPSVPDLKSGSSTPVSVVLNSSYNVQGSNRQEIEALLADHDRKLAKQLPGMVVKTVRDANSRRML